MTNAVWAVVVCGGRGERMGGVLNKTLLPVAGVPCVVRVARAFRACGASLALVVKPSERTAFIETLARFGERADAYADAGFDRQQSVYHGLLALPRDAGIALVHDGARGLITPAVIRRVIDSVIADGSGVAALPVTDTIKRADARGDVAETLDRNALRAVQTPQGFRYRDLLAAHQAAERPFAENQPVEKRFVENQSGENRSVENRFAENQSAENRSVENRSDVDQFIENQSVQNEDGETRRPLTIGDERLYAGERDDQNAAKSAGNTTAKPAENAMEKPAGRATDDAALMEARGVRVRLVLGDKRNIKLTTPEDIKMAEAFFMKRTRVGVGCDAHRLVDGRTLWLGGVEIPFAQGLLGHSDADAALHALIDAMLGAAALGDIGKHFPDGDDAYRGISSITLLGRADALLRARGFFVDAVDITIVAQRPKLSPYIDRMRGAIAEALGLPVDSVSVKATTTEGMGFEGRGEGISAHAVATVIEYGDEAT